MRRQILFVVATGLIALLLLSSGGSGGSTPIYAQDLLQEMDSLEGKNIYFAESNGENSRFNRSPVGISRFGDLLIRAGANVFTLEWRNGIPEDADLVIIPGSTVPFTPDQMARLWAYVRNGGRLLMLAEPLQRALIRDSGFFQLTWPELGLRALDNVVVTERENLPLAESTAEADSEPVVVENPELVSTFTTRDLDAEHPITSGLRGDVIFFTARPLDLDTSSEAGTLTPLIFSDPVFYGETAYAQYVAGEPAAYNIGTDLTRSALPLALAFEDNELGGRIVLFGDVDFAVNGAGLQTSPSYTGAFVFPNNARVLLRSVSWLVDTEAPEMTFPTPAPTGTATTTPSPTPTATPEPTATPTAAPAGS